MKAAQIKSYGHPEAIEIVEVAKPSPAAGQIQVEVHAASINPFDTIVREGYMQQMIPLNLPVTIGGDIAGVVTAVGPEVTGISIGDKIYGQANVVAGDSGAFAEFAVTKAGEVAKMPANVDFNSAASLPLVGISALQALTEHLNLVAGQKILIHGASGGIGSVAVQIAKHLGANVTATVKGQGVDFVKNLGADEVIDTEQQDPIQVLHDFDAVFDLVGSNFTDLFAILKPGGKAVTMVAKDFETAAGERGITAISQFTEVTTERLNRLRELVEEGIVTPHIDQVFALDQTREAFEKKESGSVKGKIVLKVKD